MKCRTSVSPARSSHIVALSNKHAEGGINSTVRYFRETNAITSICGDISYFQKTRFTTTFTPSGFPHTRRLCVYVGHTHKLRTLHGPVNAWTRAAMNENKEKSIVSKLVILQNRRRKCVAIFLWPAAVLVYLASGRRVTIDYAAIWVSCSCHNISVSIAATKQIFVFYLSVSKSESGQLSPWATNISD